MHSSDARAERQLLGQTNSNDPRCYPFAFCKHKHLLSAGLLHESEKQKKCWTPHMAV